MSERAETLGVSFSSLDIRCFKVPNTSDGVRQRTWLVAINSTIRSIHTSLSHLHEVALGQLVPHGVFWLQRISAPLRLPVLASNISIVNVVVGGSALVSPRAVLSALDVLNVHQVLHGLSGRFLGPGALNVVDLHLVAHELGRVRFDILERLKLVYGVQRVAGRIASSGLELIDARLGPADVLVGQVVLSLVQLEVKHAGASTLHIKGVVEIGPVRGLSGPHSRLCTYNGKLQL